MLVLDEAAVRKLLRMDALIPAMADALRALSAGDVVQPVRVVVPIAEHGGFLGSMPAYANGQLGAKLVTFYPNNQGIHTHHAVIVLFERQAMGDRLRDVQATGGEEGAHGVPGLVEATPDDTVDIHVPQD